AQFGLDPQPPGVGPVDGGPGGGEVLCVGQPGGVVHHGPESGVGGLAQQGVALHVVEVQGHGDGGAFGGGDGGAGEREEAAVAEPGGVLADLEDDGGVHRLGAGDNRLDVLQRDDVEGGDRRAGAGGAGDELTGGGEGHGRSFPGGGGSGPGARCGLL